MTLSVIGAGFGRTGTLSLKLALERLGLGPCYHMVEVFERQAAQPWLDAAEGRAVDWETVFDGFKSTVDWPSATFYRRLADHYPDAKVILTERDPDAWFESTQETIFARDFTTNPSTVWEHMAARAIGDLFDCRMHDRDHVISVYLRHNAEVRHTIPAERLLVYELPQGWAPLCGFLGVPVPAEPMPSVNSRDEFRAQHMKAPEA
jgi:hypothetical protein